MTEGMGMVTIFLSVRLDTGAEGEAEGNPSGGRHDLFDKEG